MTRRLVLSDLHFGVPGALAGLPEVLERLAPQLDWCDELVINGDLLSPATAEWERTIAAARPFLDEVTERVQRVVYIPGNHDHHFVTLDADQRRLDSAWGHPPAPVGELPVTERLMSELLRGTPVSVHYPAVTLDGVSYLHGHQLNALAGGTGIGPLDALLWARLADGRRRPRSLPAEDYELLLAPLYEALYHIERVHPGKEHPRLQWLRRVCHRALSGGQMPATLGALAGAAASRKLGVRPRLKSGELLLTLIAQVCSDHGLPDGPVCFAHTHQPMHARRAAAEPRWTFYNSGSWLFDEYLLASARPDDEPVHPGSALRVQGARVERVDLLADVTPAALRRWLSR